MRLHCGCCRGSWVLILFAGVLTLIAAPSFRSAIYQRESFTKDAIHVLGLRESLTQRSKESSREELQQPYLAENGQLRRLQLIEAEPKSLQDDGIRFLLLIGDSNDREMVMAECDAKRGSGNFFVNLLPKGSDWPKVKSTPLSIYACFLEKNVVLGFIFNAFGVEPFGPWHVDFGEFLQGYYRKFVHGLDRVSARRKLLAVQIDDIVRCVGVEPEVVSVASNSWDSGRIHTTAPRRWKQILGGGKQLDVWLREWKTNARELLTVLSQRFPDSRFVWRLHNHMKGEKIYDKESKNWAVNYMLKHINGAASEMVSSLASSNFKGGLRLVDLPKKFPELQGLCRDDCFHATTKASLCFADYLIETLLPSTGLANAKKSCQDAVGINQCTRKSWLMYEEMRKKRLEHGPL